jgi:hypothetical protein
MIAASGVWRAAAFLVAALPMLVGSGCGRAPPHWTSDRERAELKGPVRSVVTEFVGDVKAHWGQVDRRRLGTESFDRAGNLVEDEEYTPDFVKKRKVERKGAGMIAFRSIMGDATVHERFDKHGHLVEEEQRFGMRFSGPPDSVTRYKYDDLDRRTERDFIGPDGKLGGASIYRRDAAGNIVEETSWLNDPISPHARMTYHMHSIRTGIG